MTKINNIGIYAEPKKKQADCKKHGAYNSLCYLANIWTPCPQCTDDKKKRETLCIEGRVKNAAIPVRYQESNFDSYLLVCEQQKRIVRYCIKYVTDFKKVMGLGRSEIFIGQNRNGKTHLACAMANFLLKNRNTVMHSTSYGAINSIKACWHKNSRETPHEIRSKLIDPDLLILDDVGKKLHNETEKNLLKEIIHERYLNAKPMIVISNYPIGELTNYLGKRIMSCLRENGGHVHLFDWSDYEK